MRLLFARSLWGVNNDDDAPRAIVEEVLGYAERHDYLAMVFEGLFLKANMLWRLRRQRKRSSCLKVPGR